MKLERPPTELQPDGTLPAGAPVTLADGRRRVDGRSEGPGSVAGRSWSRLALVALALLALAEAAFVAWNVGERVPHNEDQVAYLFQARVFARGQLFAPTPPEPDAFSLPFVIDLDGRRFGKYPPGFPLVVAPTVPLGAEWLVSPTLGAAGLLAVGLFARSLFGTRVGLLAMLLGVTSPLFLVQAALPMSHAACLAFLAGFVLALRRWQLGGGWRAALAAGVLWGFAFLIRPFTALGFGLPLWLAALLGWLPVRGRDADRPGGPRRGELVALVGGAFGLAALLPLYQLALTGNPLQDLYTLWWPFDRPGIGPGVGAVGEHTLALGLQYVGINTEALGTLLFGWPFGLSLAPAAVETLALAAGLVLAGFRSIAQRPREAPVTRQMPLAGRQRERWAALLALAFAALVGFHLFYWTTSPRYYYEGLVALLPLTALGVERLARLVGRLARPAGLLVWAALGLALAHNLLVVLPAEVESHRAEYDMTRAGLAAVEAARLDRALVFVVERHGWTDYGAVGWTNSPWLDGPVIFAIDLGPDQNARVAALFPDRAVYRLDGGTLERVGE